MIATSGFELGILEERCDVWRSEIVYPKSRNGQYADDRRAPS
jgi:hypothetical protein